MGIKGLKSLLERKGETGQTIVNNIEEIHGSKC